MTTRYLKGECQHCGGHLEFPADSVGLAAPCPHCGNQTELLLLVPVQEPTIPTRAIVWTVIGVVILGLGLAGALVALKRAERWAARQKAAAAAALAGNTATNLEGQVGAAGPISSTNAFSASAIALEKAPGTSLIYAVGTIRNLASRQRFGVKVELNLFDEFDRKVGTATDYEQVLEPGAEWHFKALVLDSNATTAKLATITERQ
ncbi:MAG TPA: FxLYD domain-containing protein [Verrucomicrobiae bacterium]|nr:FxLYD domain-containing protein [Verrucomicrobiae bacterium]